MATECSCVAYSAEDKKLNTAYKLAMSRLTVSERVKLRDDQRVWLQNLEPNCKEPLGPPELAGSMWRMELCDCLAVESKKRAVLLKSWSGQESGSKSKWNLTFCSSRTSSSRLPFRGPFCVPDSANVEW